MCPTASVRGPGRVAATTEPSCMWMLRLMLCECTSPGGNATSALKPKTSASLLLPRASKSTCPRICLNAGSRAVPWTTSMARRNQASSTRSRSAFLPPELMLPTSTVPSGAGCLGRMNGGDRRLQCRSLHYHNVWKRVPGYGLRHDRPHASLQERHVAILGYTRHPGRGNAGLLES